MPIKPIPYVPEIRYMPERLIDVPTAWKEVTPVIYDILKRFHVPMESMIEFGVDYGYSTAVFANFFTSVVGVDTFEGDCHAGYRNNLLEQTTAALSDFPNVHLKQFNYKDWILFDETRYDLCHVDIVHSYEETFECGDWAVKHCPVVLFHDSIAFPDVMKAVTDLAMFHNKRFFNVYEQHGLGILV